MPMDTLLRHADEMDALASATTVAVSVLIMGITTVVVSAREALREFNRAPGRKALGRKGSGSAQAALIGEPFPGYRFRGARAVERVDAYQDDMPLDRGEGGKYTPSELPRVLLVPGRYHHLSNTSLAGDYDGDPFVQYLRSVFTDARLDRATVGYRPVVADPEQASLEMSAKAGWAVHVLPSGHHLVVVAAVEHAETHEERQIKYQLLETHLEQIFARYRSSGNTVWTPLIGMSMLGASERASDENTRQSDDSLAARACSRVLWDTAVSSNANVVICDRRFV